MRHLLHKVAQVYFNQQITTDSQMKEMPMNKFMQGMLFALLIVYVISPVDFVPGPIDDIVALLLYAAANKDKLGFGKRDNDRIEVVDADSTEL